MKAPSDAAIEITLSQLRVLVVDQSAFMRDLIRYELESYRVRELLEAADGHDALEQMRYRVPDVLITEWEMEPVSGLMLASHLRLSPRSPAPNIPILLLTGYGEPENIRAAGRAGIDDILVKPISARQLSRRVCQLVNRGRAARRRSVPALAPPERKAKQRHGQETVPEAGRANAILTPDEIAVLLGPFPGSG